MSGGAAGLTRWAWVPALVSALVLGSVAERTSGFGLRMAVGDLLAGASLVVGGAFMWARGARSGALSVAAGVTWFAGDLFDPLVFAHRGPLVHLLVAHPTGRIPSRAGLAVVIAAYVDGLVPPLARAPWPTIALAIAVVVVLARQRRDAPVAERGPRLVALAGALAAGGALACASVFRLLDVDHDAVALWAYLGAVAATGIGLAWTRRRGLTGLVVDLGRQHESSALRAAMSKALGDPGLGLAYRVAGGAWVNESGVRVDLTAAGGRRITYVGEPDAPLAALIHDPTLRTDGRLLGSVAAAARIALANIRLRAEVADRVREVTESRRRLVEAAANERRRLGGEVEAVAGRRLTAVAERLREESAPALDPLVAELEATREQLRRFAHGLHPHELSERGLCAALARSTATSPIPVVLRVPDLRFGPAQETTLFFVASEALANVAKHAQARHAEVVVDTTDHAVRLRVSDDGVGDADPARGSGLRGLADRVEALGGWLRLDSRAGAGTRLEVGLPLP